MTKPHSRQCCPPLPLLTLESAPQFLPHVRRCASLLATTREQALLLQAQQVCCLALSLQPAFRIDARDQMTKFESQYGLILTFPFSRRHSIPLLRPLRE